jgi:hypothetical protein
MFTKSFDHTYYLWKIKAMKWEEWKIKGKLEKQIMEKESENDEIS